MFLSYLTLFIALCLSAVAAFYSIAGLTAIFAAAVIPIIIMGSILEVAKIVTTLWLHEYWRQAKISLKMYLVPAVAVLMVLTSMGIFGFLSKAHLDQTVPVGDVVSQVALFDEKIKNERETIANARTLLGQLDKAVADISAGGDREITLRGGVTQTQSAAERALQVRRQQARDRAALTKTIEEAQARIVKLQEERAPIASQARKVEAEVGPVKYVAALIYGDNPDANTLEKAVRWVIIMIVIVFDPLAIMLLLAATESLGWSRKKKEGDDDNPVPPNVPPTPSDDLDSVGHPTRDNMAEPSLPTVDTKSEPVYLSQGFRGFRNLAPVVASKELVEKPVNDDDDDEDEDEDPYIKEAKKQWKAANPGKTLKDQRYKFKMGLIDRLPWLDLVPDNVLGRKTRTGFGATFPADPIKGDTFVKTDRAPNMLYKFNGQNWIVVDKNLSDNYTYDDAYLDYLIQQIESGAYDPELLNEQETEMIATRINQQSSKR